jgi:hypothetical protein
VWIPIYLFLLVGKTAIFPDLWFFSIQF